MNKDKRIDIIENILGAYEVKTAFLGGRYAVWNITHRKAINKLKRHGFVGCGNPLYIRKADDADVVVYTKAVKFPKHFVLEIKELPCSIIIKKPVYNI